MRFRLAFLVVTAIGTSSAALSACFDFGGLQDSADSDAASSLDGAGFDAQSDSSPSDGASGDASSRDGASGDAGDARVQDNSTIFCGPSLACSHADPGNGCCVTSGDAGAPPESYVYTCEALASCPSKSDAGGAPPFIACDQGSDCPGVSQVCCWPSNVYPTHTYCFKADASNCFTELCDPNDAVPCVNHPGNICVPSGPGVPLPSETTPPGYFVCVPP